MSDGTIGIVVVGAHLSGMALNHELTERGGAFSRAIATEPLYRLYRLASGPPYRPGLLRVGDGGAAIETEVWTLPPTGFASFVAGIPSPLCIGTLHLSDQSRVKGFLVEPAGLENAEDITRYGGWRAFTAAAAGNSQHA